ncbi:MAG: hypothetical protein ACR2M3_10190, partial [Thermomicrobiales bacterium]
GLRHQSPRIPLHCPIHVARDLLDKGDSTRANADFRAAPDRWQQIVDGFERDARRKDTEVEPEQDLRQ